MTKLLYSVSYDLHPVPPYDFKLTVHKPAGWSLFSGSEIFEKGTLWTAYSAGKELVGVKLWSKGTIGRPIIGVRLYLRSRPDAKVLAQIKESLESKLGVQQDLKGFYTMAKRDGILKHVVEDLYGMHDTDSSSVFDVALLAICLQMTNIKRSDQMMDAIMKNYGRLAEFDGRKIRVWPLPEDLADLNPKRFAKECNLGYRAKSMVKLAKKLSTESFPTVEELAEMDPVKAKELLLELPGIGDYSADIINPHGGFPIDVWSAEIFAKLFYGKEPKNNRNAVERVKRDGLKRWGRWSWMAFYYVAQDLENLSKKLGIKLRLE